MNWITENPAFKQFAQPLLPFGQGRSYGDVCLNDGGFLIDASPLSRFIDFDKESGLLRCEAGITLGEILKIIVPHGWFLPVTPGTKHVTLGGAIANDVHGKNHHQAGTFGMHVSQFELLRSSGERLRCSPAENRDLYNATIGGLGLTGLILWAEIKLKPVSNSKIAMEQIPFGSFDEFVELAASSDKNYHYTVAWIDCLAAGKHLGRGIFIRGNHANGAVHNGPPANQRKLFAVPFDAPAVLLNRVTIKAFNLAYYYRHRAKPRSAITHYDPFFYPLDRFENWNRLYGRRGFLQYQCVVPGDDNHAAIREILRQISHSGMASFLSVLKIFGTSQSAGMLSFPRPGITLALDFPYNGRSTLALLDDLDEIVAAAGGAVYPAKDARMSAKNFQRYFPTWESFSRYVDPKFSSSFWRRVVHGADRN